MLHRQLGDLLVLRSTEDHDRNLRRCEKEPVEGLDAAAVWQEEVGQYRRYAVRFLLFAAGQSFQTLGTASNPFDSETPIDRVSQRLSDGYGIRGIILNQKDVLRNGTLLAVTTFGNCDSNRPAAQRSVR
jgi:hypothetical protein